MGRPKSENPKDKRILVRLDDETSKLLDENAQHFKESRVEAVRRGIREVNKGIKK
jgi:hypothetical protein